MRSFLIQFLHNCGLYNHVRWIYTRVISVLLISYNYISGREKKLLKSYLYNRTVKKKLHIGCGLNELDGWLNTDIIPGKNRYRLNVSKEFTIPKNSFDFAFTEHVIEHMPYNVGKNMLSETYKSLKPSGVIRVSTPSLQFLIDLYEDDEKEIHKDYIEWNSSLFIKDSSPHDAISVFNNYVRDWGHVYIYDEKSLTSMLESVGFTDVLVVSIGQSEHDSLQNLENESRHPKGFLALESMILEARKPD